MIARLIEDGFFVGRFIYYYWKAPRTLHQVGFTQQPQAVDMSTKERVRWAWAKTTFSTTR